MLYGGIAERLVRFANSVVGHVRGGLGLVNVLASMLFGGISGSAVADTSALGAILIPLMKKKGYGTDYAVNVTITASTTGILIPPSHNMIIYSLAAGGGVSIAALFMAGIIPGILTGLCLMAAAYLVAVKRGHLSRVPCIEFLSEKGNARKGFCEESEFRAIHGFLPDYLQDLALFGYCTGMRLGEVRSLKWEYLKGDVIELQAEDAKGDGDERNARLIPMVGKDLAGILERRKIARQVKAGDTTTLTALIFHHNGNPIVDIRKAWKTACKKAGVPGRLFHDLRRSAVKNLDEAGVSRDVAMQISGHKTQAMYSRYNIADVKRVRKALERTQEFREAAAAQESKVVSMRK